MNILVEINHPAHFHFFKNPINKLSESHQVFIVARDKDITLELLNSSNLSYEVLSSQKSGLGIISEFFSRAFKLYKMMVKNKIEMILSIGGTFNVHVSKLLDIPSLVFTDTDNAPFSNAITFPFAKNVVTPTSFIHDLGSKHIKYEGHHELSYLQSNYFVPNLEINRKLGLSIDKKYAIIRLISWSAVHDVGFSGISDELLTKIIKIISKKFHVLISSESPLPKKFKKYKLRTDSNLIHHILYNSELYIGESPTMAIESALLGTPSFGVSSWAYNSGVFKELSELGLISRYHSADTSLIIEELENFVCKYNSNTRKQYRDRAERYVSEKADISSLISGLVGT